MSGHSFAESSRQAFAWLETELGFEANDDASDVVEYRSLTVYLQVARVGAPDPSFKLIDSRLGRLAEATSEHGYSQRAIAKHVDQISSDATIRRQFSAGRFPANTTTETDDSLQRLAGYWRRFITELDLESEELWRDLRVEAQLRVMALADDNPQ